ncbi:MAG: lysylphosphatidylglycerol synthase domain-containing protein [Candidatus Moraniibacteriota bacterium]
MAILTGALWLSEQDGHKATAFSTVIFDRFSGMWTTALAAFLFLFLFFEERVFSQTSLLVVAILLAAFLLGSFITPFFYRHAWFHRLVERIPFGAPRKLVQEGIPYALDRKLWWRTALWSAAFVFVGLGLSNYALFHAVGSDKSVSCRSCPLSLRSRLFLAFPFL